MSLPSRIGDGIAAYSKVVFAALLVATLVIGSGAGMVDDDSSLGQFESDSPEAEASEYLAENFTVSDRENTTTVQVIVSGENVLSKESLLRTLELQQAIRDDERINATLTENNSIVGVENILVSTAMIDAEIEELEAEFEELNETIDELENSGESLGRAGERLGRDAQQLQADRAALEQRMGYLEDGLARILGLQVAYENADAQNQTYIETEIANTRREAKEQATLDATQNQTYDLAVQEARSLVSDNISEINDELDGDSVDEVPEEELQRIFQEVLGDDLEAVFETGTAGVFQQELTDLRERGQELQERQESIQRSASDLEDRADELEARADELNETADALEDWEMPPIDEQIEHLRSMDDEAFREAIDDVLSDDAEDDGALSLMQSSYEPGSTQADARMFVVTMDTEGDSEFEGADYDEVVIESQLDLRDLAEAHEGEEEYTVFGFAVMNEEIEQSMGDSLAIVAPLALLFVVVALAVAYRDLLDIVLGVAGIVLVLVWTFGFMGWAGIAFNQMMIAIPVLLIGLSIDYAIHVFMRHREQREAQRASDERAGSEAIREQRETAGVADTVRGSMGVALAGVGVALLWVTATTMIGFLANVISPIGPIREFGLVAAFGIAAAMIVFGAMVPAAKIEIDGFLEARGLDRRKRAFGTGGGAASGLLSAGTVAARKAPVIVLLCALVFTAGGVYGASQVDTSFEDEDFLAESPPEWTEHLGPFSPGEYHAKEDLDYVNENFRREDSEADVLIRGEVTGDDVLHRIAAAEDAAAESDVAYILPTGEADVESPLSAMEDAAANNESFNESFVAADTTGDGIPDENVTALYDELLEVNEDAASVIYRTDDGEYEALRLIVSIKGTAGSGETTEEMRAIAAGIEAGGDGGGSGADTGGAAADGGGSSELTAIATGSPVVSYIVEQDLFGTVIQSLAITMVAVFAFLTVAYRLTGASASLGAVTLLPVLFTVAWILGTMHLIGMPFNVLTGMITSLTVGLGVAYSIHVSSRYTLELERQGNVWTAMETTVTGTGGALLGSAATTVGGFGVLAFAILPVLQQFGIITALTIVYAFLASVIVLPAMLVLWTRYFGPDVSFDVLSSTGSQPTASDGGRRAASDDGRAEASSDGRAEASEVPDGGEEP